MGSTTDRRRDDLAATEAAARGWWVHLLVGFLWLLFAFVVLTFDFDTVWAVAVFFGVGFVVGGATELAVAATRPDWRWLHVLFGVASIAAGIVALAWPGATFLVLAAVVAWYILFSGFFDLLASFAMREESDLWWLGLVLGLGQILIGFWAVGYAGRSIVLLVVWVGAAALARGLSEIFLGFALHRAGGELRRQLASPR